MVYWNHNTLANNMNQIEFIEALRATTSNTAGTVLDLATKALAPEMHMDSVEFIISTAIVVGMIFLYFCNKLIRRNKRDKDNKSTQNSL